MFIPVVYYLTSMSCPLAPMARGQAQHFSAGGPASSGASVFSCSVAALASSHSAVPVNCSSESPTSLECSAFCSSCPGSYSRESAYVGTLCSPF